MRYVQINTVPYGSTGSIMLKRHHELLADGVDSRVFWGRGRKAQDGTEENFGSVTGVHLDALQSRLDGKAGFHSKIATRRLLARLDELQPDVVHLHNLHGYYVNVGMLFAWIERSDCKVMWTLHDCWAFTGHCAWFDYVGCSQWQAHCALDEPCPQMRSYPKTFVGSRACQWSFGHKRATFTSIPTDRVTLVAPSHWLERLVQQSYLGRYSVEVIHNTVDTGVFRPTPSDFRERYGLGDKYVILGVASPWTERKGLGDFVRLARELDDRHAIVLVGLDKRQIRQIFKEVAAPRETGRDQVQALDPAVAAAPTRPVKMFRGIGGATVALMARIDSQSQLAMLYTASDVFFNPTREDNFPTVNLEAEACGTTVWTYDTGGCRETIGKVATSRVIDGLGWICG